MRSLEVTTEVARIEDISTVEDWIKVLTCPRCGSVSESTNKRFKFGVFDGVGYYYLNLPLLSMQVSGLLLF